MKAFVQKVLENYPRFLREKALFERHLEMRENQEMRDALVMLKIKLGVVESWFALLNVDERFAFRQALLFDQRSTSAYYEAALKWGWRLVKEGKSPWVLHEQALEKVASFSEKHKKRWKPFLMTNGTMEVQLMMNETERTVYHLICGWRRLIAEKDFYEAQSDLYTQVKYERVEQFDRLQILLENLMRLLTIDERYVIKRHLVDGLDWNCIEYEYNHKLLRSVQKSRSTLRRLQNSAIVKMTQYIEKSTDDTVHLGITIAVKY